MAVKFHDKIPRGSVPEIGEAMGIPGCIVHDGVGFGALPQRTQGAVQHDDGHVVRIGMRLIACAGSERRDMHMQSLEVVRLPLKDQLRRKVDVGGYLREVFRRIRQPEMQLGFVGLSTTVPLEHQIIGRGLARTGQCVREIRGIIDELTRLQPQSPILAVGRKLREGEVHLSGEDQEKLLLFMGMRGVRTTAGR